MALCQLKLSLGQGQDFRGWLWGSSDGRCLQRDVPPLPARSTNLRQAVGSRFPVAPGLPLHELMWVAEQQSLINNVLWCSFRHGSSEVLKRSELSSVPEKASAESVPSEYLFSWNPQRLHKLLPCNEFKLAAVCCYLCTHKSMNRWATSL